MHYIVRPLSLLAFLSLAACSAADDAVVGDEEQGDQGELSTDGSTFSLRCKSEDRVATSVVAKVSGSTFDLVATANGAVVFEARAQRPSLNVRIDDHEGDTISEYLEYIDFSDQGLETVPVDGPKALELDLTGSKALLFKNGDRTVKLSCQFNKANLQRFLAIKQVAGIEMDGVKAVGFDIDDTLAFTTPAFARGFETGGTPRPEDTIFWTAVNGCDNGCFAERITLPDGTKKDLSGNNPSTAKSSAKEIIAKHKARGHRVYAITARPDVNGDHLRDYVERELGIAKTDVFFEPDMDQPNNPKGKTDRIEALDLDVFYGDSDSDITDAAKAFVNASGQRTKEVQGVRFFRSPKSSNRKAGKLNKYHPGYYGEVIIKGSYQ